MQYIFRINVTCYFSSCTPSHTGKLAGGWQTPNYMLVVHSEIDLTPEINYVTIIPDIERRIITL